MLRRIVDHTRTRYQLHRLLSHVDHDAFQKLRAKYRDGDYGKSKYWNMRERMAIALNHALRLGLTQGLPLRILDIGTGCGYFPFVCQYYGHQCVGIDMHVPMYEEFCNLLSVHRKECLIQPFTSLPDVGGPFDLITGFLVYFNNSRLGKAWGSEEWKYFLKDLANHHTNRSASAYFLLNKDLQGNFYDQELRNFFLASGADVRENIIYFTSLDFFRLTGN